MAGLLDPHYGDGAVLKSYTPTMRERATDWVRGLLYSDDREGQQQAEKLMDVATFTPFGFGADMYDAGREAGLGNFGAAAGTLAMAGMPGPSPKRIRAYHGSPYDFDRFSMDKIGTGEGAQAYGHGLYFAEAEDVAKGYRDALSMKSPNIEFVGVPDGTSEAARALLTNVSRRPLMIGGLDKPTIAKLMREDISKLTNGFPIPQETVDEVLSIIDAGAIPTQRGRMYEVEINADPDSFLDWDKPLSEQPEAVRKMFPKDVYGHKYDTLNGSDVYEHLIDDVARARTGKTSVSSLAPSDRTGAVEMLRQAGVPGIRYLDAGSRGAGDGTRNYVVFDDSLIDIIRKYGLVGLLGGGTAAMQAMQDQPMGVQ
jgi:hypothetical protein